MSKFDLLTNPKLLFERVALKFDFDSGKYWEWNYRAGRTSGPGSYGDHCAEKARVLNGIVADLDVDSIIEFGCGDGNQLAMYDLPRYLGLDVSSTVIQVCLDKFADDPSKGFLHYTPTLFDNRSAVLSADVAMSIDVIFHLVEDDVYLKYMQDLFSCARRYVIISSSNRNQEVRRSAEHVRHRVFTDTIDDQCPEWVLKAEHPCQHVVDYEIDSFYVFERR